MRSAGLEEKEAHCAESLRGECGFWSSAHLRCPVSLPHSLMLQAGGLYAAPEQPKQAHAGKHLHCCTLACTDCECFVMSPVSANVLPVSVPEISACQCGRCSRTAHAGVWAQALPQLAPCPVSSQIAHHVPSHLHRQAAPGRSKTGIYDAA